MYEDKRCQILLFSVIFVPVFFTVIMTRTQLLKNWSLIPNNPYSFSISNSSYCHYVVKPFFNFICDNNYLNSLQLSIHSEKHICDQLYANKNGPNLFSRVHMDFQSFKNRTILLTDIENISNSCLSCHHIQIIQNKLYNVRRDSAFNYETRSRSVKLLIKNMMDTFPDIPDLDLFFSVADVVNLSDKLNDVRFNVPVFGFAKTNKWNIGLRPDGIVLMPCFTFWSWPEVRAGRWTKAFQSILNAANKTEYEKRVPKLFWRGIGNWKRYWFISMAKLYPDTMDVAAVEWKRVTNGFPLTGSNTYMTLEQHCNYKYLAHLEGNSYSSRLKYLLLCGSPVVYRPIHYWDEYWYHLLENGKNIIFFEANDNETALNNTLQFLRYHEEMVKEIGRQGQRIAQYYLNEHAVSCYWWKLLHEYAQLLGYKATLHPDAVYIDDFILGNSA